MTAESEISPVDIVASPLVRLTREGGIAIVTLNRPDKRNAMSEDLLVLLQEVLRRVSIDESVHGVIVTGEGTVFSAGADRSAVVGLSGKELAQVFLPIGLRLTALIWKVLDEVIAMPKPVIAAVNGAAVGGGMMLALACDFRIVAENSVWWLPEIELGFPLTERSLNMLRDHFGSGKTKEIGMAARRLSAQDLDRMGATTAITTARETLVEALALAHRITSYEPSAVATVKRRMNEAPCHAVGGRH